MKKKELFFLVFILLSAFLFRLYRFDFPIADWHAWRQADTSAVSRNFIKDGFDILHPRFDDLSNVGSGLDNPRGYRFVEFPIYNIFQAGFFKVFPFFTIEQWGRLISIFASLGSIIFLYLIVKKYKSKKAAFFAAFFYAFLPFNIYFNRTILPDTSMAMAILGGTYFFDLWLQSRVILSEAKNLSSNEKRSFIPIKSGFRMTVYFILSILFTAFAFLLKPYALFFTLPIIYLTLKNFGLGFIKKWEIWIFALFAILPLILWRNWMQQFPQGIPVSDWLFNGGNIRFRPSFFRWIFYERIAKLILGYGGVPILIFGLFSLINIFNFKFLIFNFKSIFKNKIFKLQNNSSLFFSSFILSSLLYLFVMARGNVQHDYYQILIIPSLAIFLGLGSEFLLNRKQTLSSLFLALCLIAMLVVSGNIVKDFFNINNLAIVRTGEALDKLIPKDAKIIAPYEGDTSFLYQTKRKGWANFQTELPKMIEMGADYLVLVNPTGKDYNIGKTYRIVSATRDYILFDLRNL